MNITEHFSNAELECHCGCGSNQMDLNFLELLEDLRAMVNKPLQLSSAYRCPSHNNAVSSTGKTGPHTTGQAVDILAFGELAFDIIQFAGQLGFTGIGIKQRGHFGGRFIHLDTLAVPDFNRPRVWSY